jgi:hypothetical protein
MTKRERESWIEGAVICGVLLWIVVAVYLFTR